MGQTGLRLIFLTIRSMTRKNTIIRACDGTTCRESLLITGLPKFARTCRAVAGDAQTHHRARKTQKISDSSCCTRASVTLSSFLRRKRQSGLDVRRSLPMAEPGLARLLFRPGAPKMRTHQRGLPAAQRRRTRPESP